MSFSVERLSATRRLLLQGAGAVALSGFGALAAPPALAAANDKYPEQAFRQKADKDAIQALYGRPAEASDKVKLDAPEIAENGAVVPVSVATSLLDVTSISVLVPENPFTIAASYKIPEGTLPSVSCRIKMAKTSKVVAIVESAGKLYSASKDVKVTLGGCGG